MRTWTIANPFGMSDLEQALHAFSTSAPSTADGERPLDLFISLFGAIRPRGRKGISGAVARYAQMVERLEQDPDLAAAVRDNLQVLIETRRLVRFFSESGILSGASFFREFIRILSHRLLPEVPDDSDLQGCLKRVFHRPDDWVWLTEVPAGLNRRFWQALAPERGAHLEPARLRLVDQMIDALLVLAYRIGATGSESEFDRLGPRFARHVVRFQATTAATQRFADALRLGLAEQRPPRADAQELFVLFDQCDEALKDARRMSIGKINAVFRKVERDLAIS